MPEVSLHTMALTLLWEPQHNGICDKPHTTTHGKCEQGSLGQPYKCPPPPPRASADLVQPKQDVELGAKQVFLGWTLLEGGRERGRGREGGREGGREREGEGGGEGGREREGGRGREGEGGREREVREKVKY